jgi:hypothetical protein
VLNHGVELLVEMDIVGVDRVELHARDVDELRSGGLAAADNR